MTPTFQSLYGAGSFGRTPIVKVFRDLGPDHRRSLQTNVCHFRAATGIHAETCGGLVDGAHTFQRFCPESLLHDV